ncbi:MAG: winged helix-turn-helix transcriptional regulator, partial [Marinobacterium sp.]
RDVFPEVPPRVEYSLSPLGQSLIPHLQSLHDWVLEHAEALAAARRSSDIHEPTGEN